jgi:hypothetical protein
MADSVISKSLPGVAVVGDPKWNSGLSILTLRGSDGFDRCLWFDTTGDLRTADVGVVEASDFNPDSSGSVIGGQS